MADSDTPVALPAGAPPITLFWRKVLTFFSGTAGGQVISIALAPVIARLYEPAEFGVFSVYLSVVGVAVVLSTGRYELAILLPRSVEAVTALLTLSLVAVGFTALIALAVIVVSGEWITSSQLAEVVMLIPLAILFRGAIQALTFFHSRTSNYKQIGIAKLVQGSIGAATQIMLGLLGVGATGLVVGSVTGYAGALAVAALGVPANTRFAAGKNARLIKAVSKRYIGFPKFNLPHAVLRAGSLNLPVLMLSIAYSRSEVGLYAMCYGTIMIPLSLVSQSIFQVFSQELSMRWRSSPGAGESFARAVLWKVSLMAIPPFAVAMLIAPSAFSLVFGEEWRKSGEIFRWLAPMMLMTFISTNFSFIPQLLHRQARALALEVVAFLLMLGSLVFGASIGDFKLTILLFSGSAAVLTAYKLYWYFDLMRDPASFHQITHKPTNGEA